MKDMKDLMDTEEGKKLSKNRGSIEKLASGRDGQVVLGMLAGENIEESLKNGDVSSVKSALENAMKTDAGKRFFSEIAKLMEK